MRTRRLSRKRHARRSGLARSVAFVLKVGSTAAAIGRRFPWLVVCLIAACTSGDSDRARLGEPGPLGRQIGDYKVGRPYQIAGVWYYPKVDYDYDVTGIASWYGPGFHGKLTANGEIYDQFALTAAHPTLPMPSIVRVSNLENGRSITLRINDRGPFKNGRIIDLSMKAAQLLGMQRKGTAKVRVQILEEESRQHAVLAQNRRAGQHAPEAAPVESVTAEPLAPPGGGSVRVASNPADNSANGTTAARGTLAADAVSWPDGSVQSATVQASTIYIQAGAFRRRDNATRLSARLSGLGKARVVPARVGQQHFYRVRLGPIGSIADADRLLGTLIATGVTDARVVIE